MQIEQDSTDNDESPSAVDEPPSGTTSENDAAAVAEDDSPSLDLIFGILKNGRRRRVIQFLRDTDGEVTLSDLAEHIAALENDTTPAQLTSSERKRVYVGLYQCHLPKMDEAGVIEYNQARGLVRRTDQATYFEQYLDRSEADSDRQWYRYYGGISALGIIPFAVSLALSVPATLVAGLLATVLACVGGCSVYHWKAAAADKKSNGRDDSP